MFFSSSNFINHGFYFHIIETKEIYEGEVIEISPQESENPLAGYGKTISHVIIGLKTSKGTKQLKLDPSIYESLQKEKVRSISVQYYL